MNDGETTSRVSVASAQLVEQGYAVLSALYDAPKVARLRASLDRIHSELDRPALCSLAPRRLGGHVEISGTGLVIHELLGRAPEVHRDLLSPDAIAVLRRALGDDMFLEFAGAVICDHTRPFFEWHNHVGGIDDEKYRRLGLRPPIEQLERVSMIVYLDDMDADSGQLLIHPRRVSGSAPAPHPVSDRHWDGEVAITAPAGTVVLMDQCAWHAVSPRMPHPSLRMFVGLWFASATSAPSERVDRSLASLDDADPLLSSVLRSKRGRT